MRSTPEGLSELVEDTSPLGVIIKSYIKNVRESEACAKRRNYIGAHSAAAAAFRDIAAILGIVVQVQQQTFDGLTELKKTFNIGAVLGVVQEKHYGDSGKAED